MADKIKFAIPFMILTLGLFCFNRAKAVDYDLKISPSDIYFSEATLIAGSEVRIYAKIHNVGSQDMVGYVSFLSGAALIGNSQQVSVLPGSSDDVFVDFTVPNSSFNILAKIQGMEPADQNLTNNETQTMLVTPEFDTDGDGFTDSHDPDDDNDGLLDVQENEANCPYRLQADSDNDGVKDGSDAFPCNSAESLDTDNDGLGNNADVDDDNDGWSDAQEQSQGSDPLRSDTDGDGVKDPQDVFPLDTSKSQAERNIFQPIVPAENQPSDDKDSETINPSQDLSPESLDIVDAPENSSAGNEPRAGTKSELSTVVTKSAGAALPFFRINNWLIWPIVGALIAALATLATFLFIRRKGFNISFLPSTFSQEPKSHLKPVKPVIQPQPSFSAKSSTTAVRLSAHVIDLKKFKK